MIAQAKREQMERARYQFFHSGAEDYSVFPKVVYDSWKRSLAYGLDPEKQYVKRLTPEELEARRRKNAG